MTSTASPKTIVDIHVLQTVPPSNINRDDTGSPKTAIYGGVRRARVSSQAWKRSTRKAFDDLLDPAELGVRTKRVVELVMAEITTIDPDLADRSEALATDTLAAAGLKIEKSKRGKDADAQPGQSQFLMFLSNQQVRHLAELAVASAESGEKVDPKLAKPAADHQHSVDLALFGRMVADVPELNVDACAQVAHALSVHAVDTEYDYFTAVDDRSPADNSGAGMIGTVEFNSSTLYRYATVNVDGLRKSLGDSEMTARAVGAFVEAFVRSMPTGKQNTFANRTLPEAVIVTVRESQSINLVGAFEDAIVGVEGSTRLGLACNALTSYAKEIHRAYSEEPLFTFVVRVGSGTAALDDLGSSVSLSELISRVSDLVRERVPTS